MIGSGTPETLAEVLAAIEKPPGGADAAAERHRRAQRLVAVVGSDRASLDRVRSTFLRRLHRTGGDLGATAGLRVVDAAMWLTPDPVFCVLGMTADRIGE